MPRSATLDHSKHGETSGSPATRERLKTLETEAKVLRRQVRTLERDTMPPITLATLKEMTALIFDLERRLVADVSRDGVAQAPPP